MLRDLRTQDELYVTFLYPQVYFLNSNMAYKKWPFTRTFNRDSMNNEKENYRKIDSK